MNKKVKIINGYKHLPYQVAELSNEEAFAQAQSFFRVMNKRRSVRSFSSKGVPLDLIKECIRTAGTAPSGAHKQPWTFCLVANKTIKHQIRVAAETEERKSYEERMSASWLKDLGPMATDASKPFLETAPYLVVVFKKLFDYDEQGNKHQNYYVNESVGIAVGMLIAAIQNAGLVTLTHTPSPMRFLEKILKRPDNERAFLLLPIGYPASDCYVPDLKRKRWDEMAEVY